MPSQRRGPLQALYPPSRGQAATGERETPREESRDAQTCDAANRDAVKRRSFLSEPKNDMNPRSLGSTSPRGRMVGGRAASRHGPLGPAPHRARCPTHLPPTLIECYPCPFPGPPSFRRKSVVMVQCNIVISSLFYIYIFLLREKGSKSWPRNRTPHTAPIDTGTI